MIHDLHYGRFEKKILLSKQFICPRCYHQVVFIDDNSCYCPKESIKYIRLLRKTRIFKDILHNKAYFFVNYSINQLKVLEVLLYIRYSTVRSISLLTSLHKDTIQHVLYKLINKNMVYRQKIKGKFYYFLKNNKLTKNISNRGLKNAKLDY